jgi:hypothetical protein
MAATVKELAAVAGAVADLCRAVDAHGAELDGLSQPVDANAYLGASLSVRRAAGVFAGDVDGLVALLAQHEPDEEQPALPITPAALADLGRRTARGLHEVAMGLSRLTGHPAARIGGPGEALGAESPAATLLGEVRRLVDRLDRAGLRILEVTDPAAVTFRKLRR